MQSLQDDYFDELFLFVKTTHIKLSDAALNRKLTVEEVHLLHKSARLVVELQKIAI